MGAITRPMRRVLLLQFAPHIFFGDQAIQFLFEYVDFVEIPNVRIPFKNVRVLANAHDRAFEIALGDALLNVVVQIDGDIFE